MCDPYNYLSQDLLPNPDLLTGQFHQRFKHEFVTAHRKDVSPQVAEVDTPEFGTGIFPQGRPDLPLNHIPAAIQRLRDYQSGGFAEPQ
jgi:hypothetical protein